MPTVTLHRGEGYVRYCYMPGFIEAWTYNDGRQPVYAEQCAPIRPRDIGTEPLTALWQAMYNEAGYIRTEDRRGT